MGNKILRGEVDIKSLYDIKEKLGSGSFGEVKRVVKKDTKKEYAVKIIKKSLIQEQADLDLIYEEVEILQKIKHENCVSLFDLYETKTKLYMVLELLTGGELYDRIVLKGSFSEKEAADLIQKLASALDYLHAQGIVHRDLKPENLIYESNADDANIKVTDFGLAKLRKEEGKKMTTACGTPNYVAPEVLNQQPYGKEVDIWSLGVISYILLCGFPPFYNEDTPTLYRQIRKGEFSFPDPYWTNVSDAAKDMIQKMLTLDPKKRATAKQVMAHPWISGGLASSKALGGDYVQRIKLMQAKRRLRRAVQVIIAVNKFSSVFKHMIEN